MKTRNILQSFIRPAYMLLLVAGTLFAACSKEHDMIEEHTDKDKTQQAAQGNIEFNFQFMDYGEPTDATRAGHAAQGDTISRDTVQLTNGLVAEVGCVSMPAKPMTAVQTRAISNGTYTIYALQGGTVKATFTGTVSGGHFTSTSGRMHLAPGTYDFVCFNDKVSHSSTHFRVDMANAGTALIGRANNVTVHSSPARQQVGFVMQHVGARVHVGLYFLMPITSNFYAELYDNSATSPTIAWLPLGGGSNSYDRGIINNLLYLNYSASSSLSSVYWYGGGSTNYTYLLPGTNMNGMRIWLGNDCKMYGQSLHTQNFPIKTSVTTRPGGFYWVYCRVRPNFLYLMSDGSVGYFHDTHYGGGSKTPVGLVLSQSRRMAIALRDAPGSNFFRQWDNWCNIGANEYDYSWYFDNYDGWSYTWDPNYVKIWPTGTVKKRRADFDDYAFNGKVFFPNGGCYHAAGYFNPGFTGGFNNGTRCYLPTIGEWKHLPIVTNCASLPGVVRQTNLYRGMLNMAFTQVGGTVPRGTYYTSTEVGSWSFGGSHGPTYNVIVNPDANPGANVSTLEFKSMGQNISDALVRPFIRY